MGENNRTQPEEINGTVSSEQSDADMVVDPVDAEDTLALTGISENKSETADLSDLVLPVVQPPHGVDESPKSIKAKTHSKKRKSAKVAKTPPLQKPLAASQGRLAKAAGISAGLVAVIAILIVGALGQFYKNKTMPNVVVAGRVMQAKSETDIKNFLANKQKDLELSFVVNDKKLSPKLADIGFQIDANKTVQNAMDAKRKQGLVAKVSFWRSTAIPAVITVNDNLLSQYVEANLPDLVKDPTDATLQFNSRTESFSITSQSSGEGPDINKLKTSLVAVGDNLESKNIAVVSAPKGPAITEADLGRIIEQANALVQRNVTLSGLGYTYRAVPADIASWITPTPKEDGVHLVIDQAKIQSYVGSIGKKISSAPQDTKVVKDATSGQEVVLQEGRDGTELADQSQLASAIASSLAAGNDVAQTMNIKVAAHKTVNMSSYDKWIEVDISAQRAIAYEHATPVKTFIVATGVSSHPTVVGEFAIWLRVRSQTMQGGSKASGDYYSIPNVEWVSYFYQDYALHGAWWRKVFGYPASHGCVNMTNDDAHWVYDWAPVGTKVIVHV